MALGYISRVKVKLPYIHALGEAFVPATDTQRRNQTIGQLAYDAIDQGTDYRLPNFPVYNFQYEPTWGGGALAVATCSLEEDYRSMVLGGVSLIGGGEKIGFYDIQTDETSPMNLVIKRDDRVVSEHDLNIRANLEEARAAVADMTRDFFVRQAGL